MRVALTEEQARRLLPPPTTVQGLVRDDPDAGSQYLARDLRLMWQTRQLADAKRASTPSAVEAASRVFNTVQLGGLTRQEVIARIGHPKESSDSVYNCPFWPVSCDALVYRFDTGAEGWQFDVILDDQERVTAVRRRGIH